MVDAKVVTLHDENKNPIAPRTGSTAIIMNNGVNLETALGQKASVDDVDNAINNAVAETSEEIALVKAAAAAAMPQSGGTFTGQVKANSDNRYSSIRNIGVQNSAGTEDIATNMIIMYRR